MAAFAANTRQNNDIVEPRPPVRGQRRGRGGTTTTGHRAVAASSSVSLPICAPRDQRLLLIGVVDPQLHGLARLDGEIGLREDIVLRAVRTELVGGDDLQIDHLWRRRAFPAPDQRDLETRARSTSKSAVSRTFVERTRESLAQLMSRDLGDMRLAVMMIDGIELKGRTNIVALGITTQGVKIPLGLWEGSTENATVATLVELEQVDVAQLKSRLGQRWRPPDGQTHPGARLDVGHRKTQ